MKDTLASMAEMHRMRDGRLEVDYLSRELMPRWKLVKVDGVWVERKALSNWILSRGKISPKSRKPLSADELREATNSEPYRIFQKAPKYASNYAFNNKN
jgi:hypothetical protein